MADVTGPEVGGPAAEGGVKDELVFGGQFNSAAWGSLCAGGTPEGRLTHHAHDTKDESEALECLRALGRVRGDAVLFHVTLEEAEDGWFMAEVPALPGCVSQGRDQEQALANVREAIIAWLWAEDQKACAQLPDVGQRPPIVAAV